MSLDDRQLAAVSKVYTGLNNVLLDAIKAESNKAMDTNMRTIEGTLLGLMNEFSVLEEDDWKEVQRRYQEEKENNTIENFKSNVIDIIDSYQFKFDKKTQLNVYQQELLRANIFNLENKINNL